MPDKVRFIIYSFKQKPKFLIGVTIGLVVGIGSAAVYASIPDGSGVIHACYNNSTGMTRIIDDSSQTCRGGETAITWNQTGPQGPQGPQGPPGSGGGSGLVSNLVGANFTGASLQYRNFSGADLHNAIFTGANLTGASFNGANLSGTTIDARAARNSATSIQNADFSGANFTSATFIPDCSSTDRQAGQSPIYNFQNENFSGATIGEICRGDFRRANFAGTSFVGGGILNSNFQGIDFRSSNLGTPTSFEWSDFSGTNFQGMTLSHIEIDGNEGGPSSDISNADFSNVNFVDDSNGISAVFEYDTADNTNFANDNLKDAIFAGTDLSTANLSGVTWSNTLCPDQTNSDANGGTCIGHLTP